MTDAPLTQHLTFTVERVYDAPRERVFSAFANVDEKAKWFGGPEGQWKPLIREMDFRRGGHERAKGQWSDGTTSDFQATFHDIRQDERIVYYYDMYVNDRRISASLATVELEPDGAKTRMTFTEHAVYLDGYPTPEDREQGSAHILDSLGAYLQSVKATV
jgi:uncharacterized protein YndB with AHSA1/START domain